RLEEQLRLQHEALRLRQRDSGARGDQLLQLGPVRRAVYVQLRVRLRRRAELGGDGMNRREGVSKGSRHGKTSQGSSASRTLSRERDVVRALRDFQGCSKCRPNWFDL